MSEEMTDRDRWFIDLGNIGYHAYGCAIHESQEPEVIMLYDEGKTPEEAAEA